MGKDLRLCSALQRLLTVVRRAHGSSDFWDPCWKVVGDGIAGSLPSAITCDKPPPSGARSAMDPTGGRGVSVVLTGSRHGRLAAGSVGVTRIDRCWRR